MTDRECECGRNMVSATTEIWMSLVALLSESSRLGHLHFSVCMNGARGMLWA